MLRMIEVIGCSSKGYSEAVQKAVDHLTDAGEKVHFFEIIEQRGAVREGKLEYQVKVKVAVEGK